MCCKLRAAYTAVSGQSSTAYCTKYSCEIAVYHIHRTFATTMLLPLLLLLLVVVKLPHAVALARATRNIKKQHTSKACSCCCCRTAHLQGFPCTPVPAAPCTAP
jgi:hypothetical protein